METSGKEDYHIYLASLELINQKTGESLSYLVESNIHENQGWRPFFQASLTLPAFAGSKLNGFQKYRELELEACKVRCHGWVVQKIWITCIDNKNRMYQCLLRITCFTIRSLLGQESRADLCIKFPQANLRLLICEQNFKHAYLYRNLYGTFKSTENWN